MSAITGTVTKLEENLLTVEPTPTRRSDPQLPQRTFALDAATRVFVPQYSRDQTLPSGRTFPVYKAVPGKREDLKVGQRVQVEWPPDGDRAVRISIRHVDVEGGEGL